MPHSVIPSRFSAGKPVIRGTRIVLTHVLRIVYRSIAGDILKKARLTHATGDTGAVTLIQRFDH